MNWGVLGHSWAVDLLAAHVMTGALRHAYLFTGPTGIGRRTLALKLAQAINCLAPPSPGQPCGNCANCQGLWKMQHPDLSVIQAERVGGTLKVEQVRELQHSLSLVPYQAAYRVALLLRFEEAHPGAANALLKTLEEPPERVILLLTAQSVESLLPTIVSRCEVLSLRPLPLEMVTQGLQQRWGMLENEARLLAHLSGGRPGYALRLHEQPEVLEQRQKWLDDIHSLLGTSRVGRFAYARVAAEDKENLRGGLQVWASLWRDVLLQLSGSSVPLTNLDRVELLQQLARCQDLAHAHQTLDQLERTIELIDRNINPRLALEVILLDLPTIQNSNIII
jgi:DNA polymerase-3 subunit delta'